MRSGRSCICRRVSVHGTLSFPVIDVASNASDSYHDLELAVSFLGLPAGDEVEHVHALMGLSIFLALVAAELDAPDGEQGAARARIDHLDQSGVEVDLGCEGRNRHQRCAPDGQDGGHSLVKEPLVAIGGFFQYEHVASGALGRPDLRRVQGVSALDTILSREWRRSCGGV
jgi:hypothetical protein